jgi:predicted neutral ceramidase superfamily lipid hydrolase
MQVLSFVYIQLNYMYIIRVKKFKSRNKGIRIFLYWGFFSCNYWFDKDNNIVSHLINIISTRKVKAHVSA